MVYYQVLRTTNEIVKVSISEEHPAIFIVSLDDRLLIKLYDSNELNDLLRPLNEAELILVNRDS